MENWREIPGHNGMYEVSDQGRVRSFVNGRWGKRAEPTILAQRIKDGRFIIKLLDDNKKRNSYAVHTLVAEAFLPNPNNYRYVQHKDGDALNNRADNLIWSKFQKTTKRGDTVTTEEKRMKLLVKCSSMPCTTKCPLHEAGIKCGEGTSFMKRDGDKYDMPDKTIELAYRMMFEGYKLPQMTHQKPPKKPEEKKQRVSKCLTVPVHDCPYNTGCHCDSPESKCQSCGWNPEVASKRLVMVYKPGGLTKNAFGLHRLKIER